MFIMPNEAWSAILGASVGSLITYRFAVTLADRQFQHLRAVSKLDAWHATVRDFVSAFAPDLKTIAEHPGSVGNLLDFLREAHKTRHLHAAARFEQFLDGDKRSAFKAEWHRYCYAQYQPEDDGLSSDEVLFLYCDSRQPPPGAKSVNAYVVERLHALLAFAKDA